MNDNPKRKKSYLKPGQPAKSTAKPNIHGSKVLLSIWWDQKGVLYYELLKPGETINEERYRTQLIRLERAIAENRPEYASRVEAIIFHHDNARPCACVQLLLLPRRSFRDIRDPDPPPGGKPQ